MTTSEIRKKTKNWFKFFQFHGIQISQIVQKDDWPPASYHDMSNTNGIVLGSHLPYSDDKVIFRKLIINKSMTRLLWIYFGLVNWLMMIACWLNAAQKKQNTLHRWLDLWLEGNGFQPKFSGFFSISSTDKNLKMERFVYRKILRRLALFSLSWVKVWIYRWLESYKLEVFAYLLTLSYLYFLCKMFEVRRSQLIRRHDSWDIIAKNGTSYMESYAIHRNSFHR